LTFRANGCKAGASRFSSCHPSSGHSIGSSRYHPYVLRRQSLPRKNMAGHGGNRRNKALISSCLDGGESQDVLGSTCGVVGCWVASSSRPGSVKRTPVPLFASGSFRSHRGCLQGGLIPRRTPPTILLQAFLVHHSASIDSTSLLSSGNRCSTTRHTLSIRTPKYS